MTQTAPPAATSIPDVLFSQSLYSSFKIDAEQVAVLYGRAQRHNRHFTPTADSYCPFCKQVSTFEINGVSIPSGDAWTNIEQRHNFDRATVTCTRDRYHVITYFILINRMTITKVGQSPSLADIANDEARYKYRRVLKGDNWSELYKAVGLAAHGEGIGSFVYLRRVFERLIQTRFNAHREAEGWQPAEFANLRMEEKIEFLKAHLPASLVELRRIYSIFSKGIHELDNQTCLNFYEAGREAIIMILEDDLRVLEELERRKAITEAVAKFDPSAVPVSASKATEKD